MNITSQIIWLFVLALPIACIAWTVTHEEVFREPQEFCEKWSTKSRGILSRKFFYLFTCEYCFSHYVTIVVLYFTRYTLFFEDWRGYILAGFALVWIANVYMSLFALIRVDLRKERMEANLIEHKNKEAQK